MNTLLESLYSLLSFITEDAQANNVPGFRGIPAPILEAMNSLMDALEKHLHG